MVRVADRFLSHPRKGSGWRQPRRRSISAVLWATLTQNADAVAEMFTVDGVLQAPLVRAGQAFPRHLEGREAIRTGLAECYHLGGWRTTAGGVGRPHGERGEVLTVVRFAVDGFIVNDDRN